MTRPSVSVIVCTRARYTMLAACLAAIARQVGTAGPREVLVVDNSDDDATRSRILALRPPSGVRVLAADRPGLSHARNLGLAAADGDVVAYLDDDSQPEPGWLAAISTTFARMPHTAVVGGPVIPIWPATGRPAWVGPWHEPFLSILDRGPIARDLASDEYLAGTNVAFRAALLRKVGGFSEALGRRPGTLLGNEEIAAAERLRADGHAIRYDPHAVVRHHVHADRLTQSWFRGRVAWQAISDTIGGEPAAPDPAALWTTTASFLARQAPEARNLVGLTRDCADAEGARAQAEAVAAAVRLLLAGASIEATMLARAPAGARAATG